MNLSYKRRSGQLSLASPAKGMQTQGRACSAHLPGKPQWGKDGQSYVKANASIRKDY